MPCPDCGGWLDRDGSVMDRATTIARYPQMAAVIAQDPWAPDVVRAGAREPSGLELAGRAAGSGLRALALVAIIAILIYPVLGLALHT